jgi:hypothetical protein
VNRRLARPEYSPAISGVAGTATAQQAYESTGSLSARGRSQSPPPHGRALARRPTQATVEPGSITNARGFAVPTITPNDQSTLPCQVSDLHSGGAQVSGAAALAARYRSGADAGGTSGPPTGSDRGRRGRAFCGTLPSLPELETVESGPGMPCPCACSACRHDAGPAKRDGLQLAGLAGAPCRAIS